MATTARVLVLYSGGTIGMRTTDRGYAPEIGYLGEQLARMPQFHDPAHPALTTPPSQFGRRVHYQIREYDPLLDSSNMDLYDWARIASDIDEHYDDWDAFVVLHGTDTLAYTASALSFMLQNLGKTVVITGSQIPLAQPRSDAVANLLGALTLAGHFEVPEVCVYFNHRLLRGNRSSKRDASGLGAFGSENYPALADVGVDMNIRWEHVLAPPAASLVVHTEMERHVASLRLYPGMTAEILGNFLRPPLRGLVLETYGSGNAPDNRKPFLDALREATDRGVVIVNCTQCPKGMVKSAYAAGTALLEAGVIGGADMTTEAALTKLSYLLARGLEPAATRGAMQQNLRGELTEATRRSRFSFREAAFVRSVARALGENEHGLEEAVDEIERAVTPVLLCAAAALGDVDALRALADGGADAATFDEGDYDGRTALHLAAAEGHLDCVSYLLQLGVDINVRDRWGGTPLQDATRHAQDEVASLLWEHGAELNRTDLAGAFCQYAQRGNLAEIARLVRNGADPGVADYDGRTALHLAASEGNLEVVVFLLAQGVAADIVDRWGGTPLADAERHGHDQVANLLR